MDTQIQRSNSSSGFYVCRKCGWPFPKPHPSSRHRRAHKKVCGKIEGYSKVAYGDEGETLSDEDSKGETLTDGAKSVEKSTRRGGSEEELFADAVTEFADVREPGNVSITDAGNLYPPSSANDAQALTPERGGAGIDTPLQQNLSSSSVDSVPSTGSDAKEGESSAAESALQHSETVNEATLDCKSEEVADEKCFGLDGKTDSPEKSFRATGDANEEAGRRLETFTSCNDRFYNMVETDYSLLREHSAVVLEGYEDHRTVIGETVDSSEALQDPMSAEEPLVEKKVEKAQQNSILTDAGARNLLDDIDSLAKSMKGVRPTGEYVECDHKDARIYDALELEAEVTNVAKEELTMTNENFSAADDEVRSGAVEKVSQLSLFGQSEAERELEHELRAVDAERELEHELPVVLLELKDAIHVENNFLMNLQESEAGNSAISSTDDNVDSKQSIATTKGRDLDQGKQEETVDAVGIHVDSDTMKRADVGLDDETSLIEEKELNSGFVDGDMNLMKENLSESVLIDQAEAEKKLEHELPITSLESKDAISVENNVQKSPQESEAANDAISGTASNVDSTKILAITEERDLDQGKREETVAALGVQADSYAKKRADVGSNRETRLIKGMISGLADGDVNLMKEKETASTFDNVKADSNRDGTISGSSDGDRNLVKLEETATVPALDVQANPSSQTNSLEGNRGSVSAATETESQPSQALVEVQTPILPSGSDDDKQEVSKPSSITPLVKPGEDRSGRNQGPVEAQTPQIPQQPASGSPGSKKNEEIGAEKQHMPLKSFLGESSPPRNTSAKEMGQEWNSPARYPTNIKREKSKRRSRSWVPFICCSSAQAS